jgi:hypothetical protein
MNRNGSWLASTFAAVALLATTGVEAAECRKTSSVDTSAGSVGANTDAGGHVSIHVKGQKTEATKSQFNSEAAFTSAWAAWAEYSGNKGPTPKTCGGGNSGMMDCVSASLLNVTAGYVCDEVDGSGNCTRGHKITPSKVAFRYAKSGGKWILNTAYPSVNDNCQ